MAQKQNGVINERHDDDVYYYNCWRLKLEGETENMCVWTKKRGSMNAVVLDDVMFITVSARD